MMPYIHLSGEMFRHALISRHQRRPLEHRPDAAWPVGASPHHTISASPATAHTDVDGEPARRRLSPPSRGMARTLLNGLLGLERGLLHRLSRDYRRRLLGRAIAGAYLAFAREHPRWVASLFDQHFLLGRAQPILLVYGEGNRADPCILARAWAQQLGPHGDPGLEQLICRATPIARAYLHLLESELERLSAADHPGIRLTLTAPIPESPCGC